MALWSAISIVAASLEFAAAVGLVLVRARRPRPIGPVIFDAWPTNRSCNGRIDRVRILTLPDGLERRDGATGMERIASFRESGRRYTALRVIGAFAR